MTHHDTTRGEVEDHDRGLDFDLATLWNRRSMLGLFAGVGTMALVGCGTDSAAGTSSADTAAKGGSTSAAATSDSAAASTASGSCEAIPEETAGPYPGDGSNGPNVLTESGIVRRDIRRSFGTASGVAAGVPLSFTFELLDTAEDCEPLVGAAVYAWHCDQEGRYSLYDQEIADENFLRGIQVTDKRGKVTFRSIFPACYSGRWPHIHFEVYKSLAEATKAGQILSTSQLALPRKACRKVYATEGYEASVANLAQVSLGSDMVFGDDGGVHQLASMRGSVERGYHARLVVPV